MNALLLGLVERPNPGFVMMVAGLIALFVRGPIARMLTLVGGPLGALAVLLYLSRPGVDMAQLDVLGVRLVLFRFDSLSFIFAFAFIIASGLAGVFALHREAPAEDAAGLIHAGAAAAAMMVGDLVSLVALSELSALASVGLVAASRTPSAHRAATRYFGWQLVSGLLLTAGVIRYGLDAGTFVLAELAPLRDGLLVGVIDVHRPGGLLILGGIGIKAAFPFAHAWLKDAYPRASVTGAVILCAFTTKFGVYALARFFAGLDWLIWIGAAMTVFPIFFAMIENDLRRVLSYSIVNQVGFMVCAIGVGSQLAIDGAAAHAFTHVIYKSLLFMSMGAVMFRAGTTNASDLGGLHRTMPLTALFCIVGAASISALPLFAGYPAKSMVMSAAHAGPGLFAAWFALLFASAGVLEHAGLKAPLAFFGRDSGKRPYEAPFNMLLAMGLAAALCVFIGVSPGWFYQLLPYNDAAMDYLGQNLFSASNVVEQLELLAFAALAFALLRRLRLYPKERPGAIRDADWLWRAGGPAFIARVTALWDFAAPFFADAGKAIAVRIGVIAQEFLGPGRLAWRAFPPAAGSIMAVIVLTLALIVALLA